MSHDDVRGFDTSDCYSHEHLRTDEERDLPYAVRKFMATDVAPVLLEHWSRATFPFEVVPRTRELGLAGLPYHGCGCGGRRYLLDGMIAMELQDAGLAEDRHSSLAKAFCTVGWARELLGGNGIPLENKVGRFVADAEAISSYGGAREMNTLIVGRSLTGQRVRPTRSRPLMDESVA